MELKEGMYARTLDGIMKIVELRNDGVMGRFRNEDGNIYFYNDMMCNPSFDVIDLIRLGDYVNGHQVYEVDRVCCRITLNGGDIGSEAFRLTYLRPALGKNMGIKSIVTKEQFESMQYKVGE